MPQIKYVGLKTTGEQAFIDDTKLEWFPGDSHEVSAAHAEKMLKHPDVFALADTVPAAAETVTAKTDETRTFVRVDTPKGQIAVELQTMSREDLHALAKERGVKVHHTSGAAKVIEALQDAFAVKKPE